MRLDDELLRFMREVSREERDDWREGSDWYHRWRAWRDQQPPPPGVARVTVGGVTRDVQVRTGPLPEKYRRAR